MGRPDLHAWRQEEEDLFSFHPSTNLHQGHFCEKGPAFTLLKGTEKANALDLGLPTAQIPDWQDVLHLINVNSKNYSKQVYFTYYLGLKMEVSLISL